MIGIDEVGRGCWAGPLLVVAARQVDELPPGLNDSKKLTKNRRNSLAAAITQTCTIGEGWVTAQEIDEMGLTAAMRLATSRSLISLKATQDEPIVFDGSINYCDETFTDVCCVIKADSLHPIVSAASIWAKVARDEYMAKMATKYPGYGFETHVGYGTAKHIKALVDNGVTPIHRLSYKPVRKLYDAR